MPRFPSNVVIREVGLRDGLQSIPTVLPTERKLEWIREAHAAGQREIEVGSFVPPRLLPQLADTAELVAFAKTLPDLFVSVLVPNLKGAERAIDAGADLLLVPLSASHAHSLANLRKTPDEVIAEFGRIRAARDAAGSKTLIEGGIGTAFGCTIQGEVEHVRGAALHAGAARRRRRPRQHRRHRRLRRPGRGARPVRAGPCRSPASASGAATSTTRAASRSPTSTRRWRPGVARFDATLAGIGGCPHAPGASGNASSEDLAFMLASMGIETGIDLGKLLALRAKVAGWLEGETLHGTLWRAGLPKTFDRTASPATA